MESTGEGVHEALLLAGQLSGRHDSWYAAELAGGPQFFGWSDDRVIAADMRDLLLVLSASLGGNKVTKADLYPRPEAPEEVVAPQSIAEFDVNGFLRKLTT